MGQRNVVHGTAVIGDWPQDRKYHGEFSETIIGDDNVFRESVTIHRGTGLNTKTVIGSRNYFMVNTHVGHNGLIGNDITMVNGAMTAGHVQVSDRAIIGGYCAIHQFTRVGRLAMTSNGAMYNVDVPPFFIGMSTNFITQLNRVGMIRSGMSLESINAVRRMFKFLFRTNAGRTLGHGIKALPAELTQVAEVREFVEFCQGTKRGIARFQAWSSRDVDDAGERQDD